MAKINVITPNNLGKGITHNPQSKKWEVNVDNSTITVNPQGQLVAQGSGGLDCAAIAALPKTAWKPNTSILVNQDGECKRLVPNENIFTDIVVDLAANKQNVEIPKNQSETVNIIATVTNAGANPTGEVLVTLTKPQLGTYHLGTPTTNNIGETKTGELTWKVPAMASGKSLVITLPVTFSKVGSFSFGLQATSTIDTNTQNNNKTMTFTVTERIVNDGANTNYVPTGVDCPLIIATDLTYNKRLNVCTNGMSSKDKQNIGTFLNVFADGKGLAGKKIKLEGASTVAVTNIVYYNNYNIFDYIGYDNFMGGDYPYGAYISSIPNIATSNTYSPSTKMLIPNVSLSFGKQMTVNENSSPSGLVDIGTFDPETQIFTFKDNLSKPSSNYSYPGNSHCVIWCRPAGKDCKWQGIPIISAFTIPIAEQVKKQFLATKVKGNVEFEYPNRSNIKFKPSVRMNQANFVGGEKPNDLSTIENTSLSAFYSRRINDEVIVHITAGEAAEFIIEDYIQDAYTLENFIYTGKVSTNYVSLSYEEDNSINEIGQDIHNRPLGRLTVKVAADATSTDSIYTSLIKIIIKG